jgi:hypothetical protein
MTYTHINIFNTVLPWIRDILSFVFISAYSSRDKNCIQAWTVASNKILKGLVTNHPIYNLQPTQGRNLYG